MKALFVADNIPTIEMYLPIIKCLPSNCESRIVNYNGFKLAKPECIYLRNESKNGINSLLKAEKPDVIIIAREETNNVEHFLAVSGIPTVLVPHGLLMPNEKRLWGSDKNIRANHLKKLLKQGYYKFKNGGISYRLIKTGLFRIKNDFKDGETLSRYDSYTKIASYGSAMNDILIRYGVGANKLIITGNPKYDKYRIVNRKRSGRVLLITDYLVEFGLWSISQRIKYLKDICGIVNKITGKKLEILIHPVLENLDDYRKIIDRNDLQANVYQLQLTRLINECDLVITTLSTSGLEVAVAGKPLIIYNPYDNPTLYDGNSGAYIAKTSYELAIILSKLKNGAVDSEQSKKSREFILKQAYLQDGNSAKRIAELIVVTAEEYCVTK